VIGFSGLHKIHQGFVPELGRVVMPREKNIIETWKTVSQNKQGKPEATPLSASDLIIIALMTSTSFSLQSGKDQDCISFVY
jgi:hypothetical protein